MCIHIYIYICTFLCVCSTTWIFSKQALSDIFILYFISSRRGCTVSPVLSCLRLCDQSRGAPDFPQLHGINDTMKWGLRCPGLEQLTGFHQFTVIGSYAQPFLIAFGCFTHLFSSTHLKMTCFCCIISLLLEIDLEKFFLFCILQEKNHVFTCFCRIPTRDPKSSMPAARAKLQGVVSQRSLGDGTQR